MNTITPTLTPVHPATGDQSVPKFVLTDRNGDGRIGGQDFFKNPDMNPSSNQYVHPNNITVSPASVSEAGAYIYETHVEGTNTKTLFIGETHRTRAKQVVADVAERAVQDGETVVCAYEFPAIAFKSVQDQLNQLPIDNERAVPALAARVHDALIKAYYAQNGQAVSDDVLTKMKVMTAGEVALLPPQHKLGWEQFNAVSDAMQSIVDARLNGAEILFFGANLPQNGQLTNQKREEGLAGLLSTKRMQMGDEGLLLVDTGMIHALRDKDSSYVSNMPTRTGVHTPSAGEIFEDTFGDDAVAHVMLQPDVGQTLAQLQAGHITAQELTVRIAPYIDSQIKGSLDFDGGLDADDFDDIIYYRWNE